MEIVKENGPKIKIEMEEKEKENERVIEKGKG